MFNGQKKPYNIYSPEKALDKYNQEIISWNDMGTALVFISLNKHATPAVNNSVFAQQCEYIGVTSLPSSLDVGWRVDKYEVVFVVDAGRERFLYLKDYGNRG